MYYALSSFTSAISLLQSTYEKDRLFYSVSTRVSLLSTLKIIRNLIQDSDGASFHWCHDALCIPPVQSR
ncbi:hypothetical protein BDR03DRAFT_960619 [Suillus americanus]|nr:hypothetical protein BDR03DRAFT_960619 [Suillus americanus]